MPVNASVKKLGTVSSSPFSGSPTYDAVPFHVEPGYEPTLGSFVLIGRNDDGSVFHYHYGRIVGGIEENPMTDPWRLQRGLAYGQELRSEFGDLSPHRARVARAELLGEVVLRPEGFEFREPTLLPRTGAPVYECPADVLSALLGLPKDGLTVGEISSGGTTVPCRLPSEVLARHIAIVGRTGVGKTYAAHVLVEELVDRGVPVLFFDVLGDALEMTKALGGIDYKAGEDFRVPFSLIGLAEFLSFIPNLTRDQSELVALAYEEVFNEALKQLETSGRVDIPLKELLGRIKGVAGDFGQGPVGERAARRVEAAVRRSPLLGEQVGDWPERLADRPVVNVYLGHLSQELRNLAVGASARLLQILRRRRRVPPFVLVLDEAHLFLPGGGETTPSTRVIRELVRTARHDAIGIVLLTQSPSSMDKQALLTCNTRLVFALDREDLRLISGMMGDLPEEVVGRIARLPKGRAFLVSGQDIVRHPVEIRIRTRMTPEGAPTPDLIEEARRWKAGKKVGP